MRILDAEATSALLPYAALAGALEQVLRDKRDGRAYAPPRLPVPLGHGATLLLMPASDDLLAITKLVTVHPDNSGKGMPVVQADVLAMETSTGKRLALLEGGVVTARRTAALSLLAARVLAPQPLGPLLIIGTGTQARAHLEAFAEGLGVGEVYLVSRDAAHAEALAAYARGLGVTANAVSDPREVLDRVTLIVTATTSPTPVLPENVREDAFVAAVGAYTPHMSELPPALVRRARVYVDTLEGAQAEAGDLIQASVDWSAVMPLEDVLDLPRPEQGPVIFKSVGHALWDLPRRALRWQAKAKVRRLDTPTPRCYATNAYNGLFHAQRSAWQRGDNYEP